MADPPVQDRGPASDVRLTTQSTAEYAWAGYTVKVVVGYEDHLDRDNPDSTALYRQVCAHATLLVPQTTAVEENFGHVEWEMTDPQSEMAIPPARAVAAADLNDPRFASAVLATVAKALVHARIATVHASAEAEKAADEVRWEAERPDGVNPRKWLRDKRAERDVSK